MTPLATEHAVPGWHEAIEEYDPAFTLHGAITSTGGSATLLVVNGPIRARIGLNSGSNVFGPGWRANATIGRAIRLVTLNCLGAQPGILDRSTQGHPGKYSFCIAENEEESPWEPLHVERGLARETSAVTVYAAEGPHNVLSHYGPTADAIVVTLADTMACLGSFSAGESFVVLAPEHVKIFARDRWTKRRLEEALYAGASRPRARGHPHRRRGRRPRWALGVHPVVEPRAQLARRDSSDPRHEGDHLMTITILDPTVAPAPADAPLAKRVADLDGAVLGLLANGKVNGDRLLDIVREELSRRYDVREVVVMTKTSASRPAEDPLLEQLAARCDVVVTAIGD